MSQSFTYAYFTDAAAWKPADDLARVNAYEVTRVKPIIGEDRLDIPSNLLRLESSSPLTSPDQIPTHLFRGVTQHLHYTDASQRKELLAQATPEFAPSPQTVTVIIPIRKSQAWWDLPQDERIADYRKTAKTEGHTAIGLPYVQHIFRKLYHCRYLESANGFDFITYFEFQVEHTDEFLHLLQSLRNLNVNPEWAYVESEIEIWTTKTR